MRSASASRSVQSLTRPAWHNLSFGRHEHDRGARLDGAAHGAIAIMGRPDRGRDAVPRRVPPVPSGNRSRKVTVAVLIVVALLGRLVAGSCHLEQFRLGPAAGHPGRRRPPSRRPALPGATPQAEGLTVGGDLDGCSAVLRPILALRGAVQGDAGRLAQFGHGANLAAQLAQSGRPRNTPGPVGRRCSNWTMSHATFQWR